MNAESPLSQSQYQVRFDWGIDGALAIAVDVDVIVLVDILGSSPAIERELAGHTATVVAGSLHNCAAIADWALAQQGDKGDRFGIAVVAAGELRENGSVRFALEDLLGAGAVIEALAEVGIDYYSPEAAAAAAAFTGLRNATGHLVAASATGREMSARGERVEVLAATQSVNSTDVPIL